MRLPLLLALGLMLAPPASAQPAPPAPRTLQVSGAGEAAAAPDMATVSVGVTSTARRAGDALAANSAAMQGVLDLIRAEGVADRDVQTSQFSLSPMWRDTSGSGSQPGIDGYQVYNLVTVRLRDLPRLGALLDTLTREGANQINGIEFGLSDPRPLLDAARRAAVTDAVARARLYAEAAGVTLGPILSISEGGGYMPMPGAAMRAEAAASPVPVAGGETGVNAQVSLVYEIR